MKKSCQIAVASMMMLIAASATGNACEGENAVGRTVFPLSAPPGKRFLEDALGTPFFMHGDTSWSLIAELGREQAEFYLRDRKSRGFNTILVNLIEHKFATNAPENIYGERPFMIFGDLSSVNERYFEHVDWVLEKACELGFLVLLAPAYLGYGGGTDGWYADMERSGTDKLRAFGRFVGARYKDFDNIMWVHGGDHNPADRNLVRVIAEGIAETDPGALHTAHGAPETDAADFWAGEPWLSVNNVYTYGPVHLHARRQYARDDEMPFFLMESAYEFEHGADAWRIRIQAYSAVLSGAFGHLYGNNPIWHFSGPGLHPPPMEWKAALDSPGAQSMSVLGKFFGAVPWWRLQPDVNGRFLLDGYELETPPIAATANDGSFALVYLPESESVTLDLASLAGESFAAQWRDPADGSVSDIAGSPFFPHQQTFRPQKENSMGDGDWLLEVFSGDEPGGSLRP